ncbi:type I-B CRISPR-associated protein Cas8b1/Cst1 [Aneurinibacillus tyrosinisolvens]|uniref:type I-B CRISPR-associated protein Cas8b1/Cst1 n=1 Tax=Aneurinibacillus tyrosinisolvens TaxID=1443435 RepID=UPI00063F9B31|nr:type I-B CRISPR-associated protein Cas8b1/Cst1 [Aneurinibacillus tyrosinisolvens]
MISLQMGEWHISQGLVGFYRIMKQANHKVQVKDDGLQLSIMDLEMLPESYFHFFLDKYSVLKRDVYRLEQALWRFRSGKKEAKKVMDDIIKSLNDKIGKYFSDLAAAQEALSLGEQIRKSKEYTLNLEEEVSLYCQRIGTKVIHDKLTSNYFKAVVLGPYFGQVSFLNVVKNDLNIPEQVELFRKDYIVPAIEEYQFTQLLKTAETEQEITQWLEECNHTHLTKLKRPFKKLNLEQMREYITNHINRCSFFDGFYAFEEYNEGNFSPLALSAKNAINFTWEGRGNLTIPMSAIAKLILFCAPAGAVISGKKSLFVQLEGTFHELLHVNESYALSKEKNKVFDEIVFDIVRETQQKSHDTLIKHYLFLEYESDYSSKKTLLDYLILTPAICKLFMEHHVLFTKLSYSLRDSLVHEILRHRDPKPLLITYFRENIDSNFISSEVLHAVLIRHFYQRYQKGGINVAFDARKESDKVKSLYRSGFYVQQEIGERKAEQVAYRLLNATRAGDKQMFMDTVMRLYISAEKRMPQLLLNALHEDELDFPTVANAWIAGLISKKEEKKDEQK